MLVYVAGPYSQGDREENTKKAMEVASELLLYGLYPFIPHLTHYFDAVYADRMDYEAYLEWDIAFMLRCDIVLRMPGESAGADRELGVARAAGMPIAYDMGDVLKWASEQDVGFYAR